VSLREQLEADLRAALRSGDETRKSTLRLLLTAVRNAEIPPEREDVSAEAQGPQRLDLDDEAILQIVRREVKQRRDSIEAYSRAVMPVIMAELRDKAEGREINAVVSELLAAQA
jgi:uncharacterized protein YqeY